ncbi:MAG: asparagine synthase (glutamine-hydrolyzing) [Candidatus Sabulitectum sp.]|nr:asparagine synthase (glutamine-hydrolyzing) [Candidatus Sabulitectum sp.]
MMCGFSGFFSLSTGTEEGTSILRRMGKTQSHRGPDDSAVLLRGNVGISFVRLSILDLATGMQPIVSKEDGVAIACNGQIYNYIELRKELPYDHYETAGDMEVALNAYRHLGENFPNSLNGMFAGVIHDPEKNALFLFRDRFGIKPVYYTETSRGFFFASEIKPLLGIPGVRCEMENSLLPAFFTYRYIPGEKTLFKGIFKLPPASILKLNTKNGEFEVKQYWEWSFPSFSRDVSLSEASEEFNRLFTDAVRIRLRSDVEVGSFISGGIDSSAVASIAAIHKPSIKLFTIGFGEDRYDETADVDEFLGLMGSRFSQAESIRQHCVMDQLSSLPGIIRSIEEPISLGTMLPTDQVCSLASKRLKVVLSGEGADEIFAGYRKFLVEAAALEYPTASVEEKRRLLAMCPELSLRLGRSDEDHLKRHIASEMLFNPSELVPLLGLPRKPELDMSAIIPSSLNADTHPISAMQAIEVKSRLPNYVNLRLDKLSMRHSLETRTPFLDYRLAEFSASLPVKLRVNLKAGQEKYICRESFNRFGVLPRSVADRPKKPFTMPIADWFSRTSVLPESIQDILLGNEIHRQGILDGDLVRKYATEVTGSGVGPETMISAGDRIFSIVVFSLWYREFMEGSF